MIFLNLIDDRGAPRIKSFRILQIALGDCFGHARSPSRAPSTLSGGEESLPLPRLSLWARRFLGRSSSTHDYPGPGPVRRARPRLEVLKDRVTPATITVNSPSDASAVDGMVSLREAIQSINAGMNMNADVNADTGLFGLSPYGVNDTILFSQAPVIFPNTPLPQITKPVVIDGYPGTGAVPNSAATGTSARLSVGLDGLNLRLGTRLDVAASGVTIRGLAITDFVNSGIVLEGPGGDVVAGDFIGVNVGYNWGGNGGALIGTSAGITILNSPNNRIGGTAPADVNLISANGVNFVVPGVDINGANAGGNLVEGNLIGTNTTGMLSWGNTGDGVLIRNGAHDNTVGGSATGAGNVISGNSQNGVEVNGTGSTNNFVQGNLIGVTAFGWGTLSNGDNAGAVAKLDGVFIKDASGTTVGGTAAGARNVISGNEGNGIHVLDSTGTNVVGTVIQNNLLGVDADGARADGNWGDGVWLDNAGASLISDGNVISSNNAAGVEISGSGAVLNVVEGDFIGTDATGMNARGNLQGVLIRSGASGNHIGGTNTGDGDVISGNFGAGVELSGSNVINNWLKGNLIGVNKDDNAALRNTSYGVELDSGANHNLIGGTEMGARNVISGNGVGVQNPPPGTGVGVYLTGNGTSFNQIIGDSIGTDLAGTRALGNAGDGIFMTSGADSNTIGAAGVLNYISANGGYGLDILSTNNTIDDSYVGLDANGNGGAFNNAHYLFERTGVTNTYGSPPNYRHQ
jgi:titin